MRRGLDGMAARETRQAVHPAAAVASATANVQLRMQKRAQMAEDSQVPALVVDGLLAPDQLTKRSTSYNALLNAANTYSMKKYGRPFDFAKASRDFRFATQPATQNTLNYLASLTGNGQQGGNLDALINISNGIGRTKFPALNNAAAWALLESGDPKIAAYHTAVVEVADQFAKIMQGGGSGSGTSDAKIKQASEMFSSGFNKEQIKSVAYTAKTLLSNREREMVRDNPYLRDYADAGPASNGGGQSQGGWGNNYGGRRRQ